MSFDRILFALIFAVCSFGQKAITPKELMAQIDRDGAKAVVDRLIQHNERDWDYVTAQMETGSNEWLDVIPKIAPGTDAATGEALPMILSRAMTHNPDHVLRMLDSKFKLEDICAVPFIEPTDAQIRRHKAALRAALKRVTALDLQDKKKACLAQIVK